MSVPTVGHRSFIEVNGDRFAVRGIQLETPLGDGSIAGVVDGHPVRVREVRNDEDGWVAVLDDDSARIGPDGGLVFTGGRGGSSGSSRGLARQVVDAVTHILPGQFMAPRRPGIVDSISFATMDLIQPTWFSKQDADAYEVALRELSAVDRARMDAAVGVNPPPAVVVEGCTSLDGSAPWQEVDSPGDLEVRFMDASHLLRNRRVLPEQGQEWFRLYHHRGGRSHLVVGSPARAYCGKVEVSPGRVSYEKAEHIDCQYCRVFLKGRAKGFLVEAVPSLLWSRDSLLIARDWYDMQGDRWRSFQCSVAAALFFSDIPF